MTAVTTATYSLRRLHTVIQDVFNSYLGREYVAVRHWSLSLNKSLPLLQ